MATVADTFTDEAIERTYGKGEDCMTILNLYDANGTARHGVIRPRYGGRWYLCGTSQGKPHR